jgi:hypothetical protein
VRARARALDSGVSLNYSFCLRVACFRALRALRLVACRVGADKESRSQAAGELSALDKSVQQVQDQLNALIAEFEGAYLI